MAKSKAQKLGDDWENEVEADTGGHRQPQSGAGPFFKLDIEGASSFLISAKATDFKTYPIGNDEMQEIERALVAPGGVGPSALPIVALKVRGAKLAGLRWEDLLEMAREPRSLFRESRTAAKRRRAAIPQLLRQREEDDPGA